MGDSWVVQNLRAVIADLGDECSGSGIDLVTAEGYKWRIELMLRELLAIEIIDGTTEVGALECVENAYRGMSKLVEELMTFPSDMGISPVEPAQTILTGSVGRPRFAISYHQLQYLVESRFSVPQIADLIGVSVSTIRLRMTAFYLSIRATYASLTDEQLDEIVVGAQQNFPNWGNRQMYGHLISLGIRVPFHRVRESQSRVDPEGSIMRKLRNLRRRCYNVRGPQHLWHIDGNHKLIK